MNSRFFDCIDCGTENCPCYLAETEDCLVCGRLRGSNCDDCGWRGVCVYNEFIQNGRRILNPRKSFPSQITYKKFYGEALAVIGLATGRGFALKCEMPGSYVFIRSKGALQWYDTPISVMKVDINEGVIYLAVKEMAGKTKLILEEQEILEIRGVYRNGILGIKDVIGGQKHKKKKNLIVARGLGFAPAVLLADWIGGRASLDMILDEGGTSEEWISEYTPDKILGITARINLEHDIKLGFDSGLYKTVTAGNYDNIIVLASDYYINEIKKLMRIDAMSNNFNLCCGEGICGACSVVNSCGETFKMCKCAGIKEGFDV
ncbi:MAG: hypothetical protein PHW03_06820 [Eubacteriales bacterium]|nr:hypothetical protein [Eubacteriales bacterium]